jgi:hypothetical protein
MSLKAAYTSGARGLASRSMSGLARTRLTPNMLTTAGVTLCALGGVLVYFEYRNELLWFWLGAAVFVVGSVLDILDGALATAPPRPSCSERLLSSSCGTRTRSPSA